MKMNGKILTIALLAASILLPTHVANAGVIRGAASISSNNMGTEDGSLANIINQSGLSAGYTSGITDFGTYAATHPTVGAGNGWAGLDGPVLGDMEFDLGGVFLIESFALWTQSNGNAINSFDILIDGTNAGSFNGIIGAGPNIAIQTFALSAMNGQFVTLRVNSLHGGFNANIGEVAFETTAATNVPAPATLALLGLGLVSVGWSRRKA